VIDSAFSLRARYVSTSRVLKRYRAARQAAGRDADADNLTDLVAAIDSVGGSTMAAGPALFDNHGYAPGTARAGRPGLLKAEAVDQAARRLLAADIDTIDDLRAHQEVARQAWLSVHGLGWVSWDYLEMLTGDDGVKADTMVQRFVAAALEARTVGAARAKAAVLDTAELMHVDARILDHAIWLYEHERLSEAARRESRS
jgi:hypothetical protein